ncbi:hypothetical protein CAEBREN_17548 [Caenorhabditis brenneri]|uniref:Uncharacterized protein n=1 Tax=Caenorhabditis brenneri TaxID=135651 RepID=G0PLW9_CAEBE|nr:hypothetical protein CAEBREN_17548 [Caenorhabditis brenneri]
MPTRCRPSTSTANLPDSPSDSDDQLLPVNVPVTDVLEDVMETDDGLTRNREFYMALETVDGIEETQLMTQKSVNSNGSVVDNDLGIDDGVQVLQVSSQTPGNRKRDKLKIKRQADAARKAVARSAETIKDKELRLEIEAVQKSIARSQATRDERNAKRRMDAIQQNERRSEESEEKRRCRLDSVASQAAERRNRETEDEWIARIEAQQARRDLEDEEERARRLEAMAERAEIRRAGEPEDVRQDRLEANRVHMAESRANDSPDQAAARRDADNQRRANRRSPLLKAATTDARPELNGQRPRRTRSVVEKE